jgi:hypothetical protein
MFASSKYGRISLHIGFAIRWSAIFINNQMQKKKVFIEVLTLDFSMIEKQKPIQYASPKLFLLNKMKNLSPCYSILPKLKHFTFFTIFFKDIMDLTTSPSTKQICKVSVKFISFVIFPIG